MARPVAVVVLTLVVLGSVVGAVAGPAHAQETTSNVTTATADYSLDQLRPNGQLPANAPDSVRAAGTYGEYAVKHLPTGLFVDTSDNSPSWRYLRSGTKIKRDSVQLWSKRGYGQPPKDVTVRIAYWGTDRAEVTRGNETRTRTVAANVTSHTVDASLAGGYDYVDIPLQSHLDSSQEVTMCIEEAGQPNCLANPGSSRWRFTHATSAAAQTISYNTAGGQIAWAIGILVLPFAGFSAGTLYVSRKMIRAARSGPNISILVWIGVLVALMITIGVFWDAVVSTLVAAPWVLAIVSGVIVGIVSAEWFGDKTYLGLFLRLRTTDVVDDAAYKPESVDASSESPDSEDTERPQSPADERGDYRKANLLDTPGKLVADAVPLRMARSKDGTRSRIGKGFWKFMARFRGARADLEVDGNLSTKIDVEQGPYREMFILDPEDDDPIDYKGEGHRFEFPELVSRDENGRITINTRAILGGGFALGLSYGLGSILLNNGVLGLTVGGVLLFVAKIAQPDPGHLKANLAPMHYGNALSTLFGHAKMLGEARTWEDLYDEVTSEKASNKAEKQRITDRRTTSQADEIVGEFVGDDQEASADD
ncbi:MAG: hypothetical protein U9O06_06530 [Euryarchaeota archaeon]|nr:hypothetical protein [Euryarchaeota archaeon]